MSAVIPFAADFRSSRSRAPWAGNGLAASPDPYPGDPAAWAQPLWALGQQGRLWIESGGPECRLAQVGSLAGIRVGDRVALLQSGRLGLGILLDRPQNQGAIPGGSSGHLGTGLWIDDRDGTALLRVSHWAGTPALDPSPAPAPPLAAAHRPTHESLPGLRRRWESLARIHDLARPAQSGGPGFDDIAELCGWMRLDEARLRERGRPILADPDLVPCLLETLAEQALPVRVAVGDGGVVQWVDDAFQSFEPRQDRVQVQGTGLRLVLSRAALDSAWVLIQGQGPSERRQVRLYGEDGRALALIESAPSPRQCDCPLWRTLANALVD